MTIHVDTIRKKTDESIIEEIESHPDCPNKIKKKKKKYKIIIIPILAGLLLLSIPFALGKMIKTEIAGVSTAKLLMEPEKDSKIIIPKLNAEAPIVLVDSRDNNDVMDGLSKGVVRYGGTANPGEKGNSFIIGHSFNEPDNKDFRTIFTALNKLEKDDQITVIFRGKEYVYKAVDKKIVAPNDLSVLSQENNMDLTLMASWPPGATVSRLVVQFTQI